MTTRPFRHLCPEADLRDGMTADDYWHHIYDNDGWRPVEDEGPDLDAALNVGICDTCGANGACAYDSEGRALIHASGGGDEA